MGIRDSFVKQFGEANAQAMENAAHGHENGVNSDNKGADPFRWAILICIGYQCFEIDSYRDHHRFTAEASFPDIKRWIIEEADIGAHKGDCDYLSLVLGKYNDYLKPEKSK